MRRFNSVANDSEFLLTLGNWTELFLTLIVRISEMFTQVATKLRRRYKKKKISKFLSKCQITGTYTQHLKILTWIVQMYAINK